MLLNNYTISVQQFYYTFQRSETIVKDSVFAIIIIALREEFEVFIEVINKPTIEISNVKEHVINDKECRIFNITCENKESKVCIAVCIDKMGITSAKSVTRKFIDTYYPKIVINAGYAGRYDNDFFLGDIIIGDNIDAYSEGGKIEDIPLDDSNEGVVINKADDMLIKLSGSSHNTTLPIANFIKTSSKSIIKHVKKLQSNIEYKGESELANKLAGVLNSGRYKVDVRSIASGPFVSASKRFKEIVLQKDRKFSCVEMEAAGVAWACREMYPATDCVILKTIVTA